MSDFAKLVEKYTAAPSSVSALADELGVTRQMVWFWKKGKHLPYRGRMEFIVKFKPETSIGYKFAKEAIEIIE